MDLGSLRYTLTLVKCTLYYRPLLFVRNSLKENLNEAHIDDISDDDDIKIIVSCQLQSGILQ